MRKSKTEKGENVERPRCPAARVSERAPRGRRWRGVGAACRREGFPDATPGCEEHTYLYDQPSWTSLANDTGARILIFDQCMTQDSPTMAYQVGRKATAVMASELAWNAVVDVFTGMRCNHAAGSHVSLRGADARGNAVQREAARLI